MFRVSLLNAVPVLRHQVFNLMPRPDFFQSGVARACSRKIHREAAAEVARALVALDGDLARRRSGEASGDDNGFGGEEVAYLARINFRHGQSIPIDGDVGKHGRVHALTNISVDWNG